MYLKKRIFSYIYRTGGSINKAKKSAPPGLGSWIRHWSERQLWLIQGYRQVVIDDRLVDVHMDDYSFTWFKSLGINHDAGEKLDRAMANDS
jgi:hypothetical protein